MKANDDESKPFYDVIILITYSKCTFQTTDVAYKEVTNKIQVYCFEEKKSIKILLLNPHRTLACLNS